MPSQQLLPVTNRYFDSPTSSVSGSPPSMAAVLLKIEDDPSTGLYVSPSFDDDKNASMKPLLPRASSYTSISTTTTASNNNYQQRRRRINSDNSLPTLSSTRVGGRRESLGRDETAAEEAFVLTRLSLKLLRYLGVGYRWITRFLALGCYAFFLMPGFLQVGYYYFFSSQVRRGIVYGDHPRNRLDLYLPKDSEGQKPVIAFVTGGAWIIGNFPQGTISDMVNDASQGISFVCNHIAEYGGDPNRIYLMGQSAGAHIAACTLLEQAIKEAGEGERISWSISQIKAYFGLSGGYNLLDLVDHFHNRGLYRSIFLSIMEGEQSLQRFSPEILARDPNIRTAVSRLPPIILFHGTGDYSIPSDASKNFAETLKRAGVKAEAILYEGKTHTDLFLQDPMRGGSDQMFEDLIAIVHANDPDAIAKDATAPPRRRLVPEFLLKLAHNVSPF
ncbi:probable isoprenylcysteine alpha-carbonyl methylesterase ICMEL1 isoform X2 [Ziziphus jujuba]|uniref:protein-S-isoprenylcysteine alpha-carbonyl methylesterase n=1 Tax=Ziziphus jujuba TaxID=326968 RepID=A0ABM3I1V3_ZIZJJ|nr:probable isoprenylcysteine alpha-carbonyl methylesterase ICMEL1 isoform X2 [Ziziphus jujuba]